MAAVLSGFGGAFLGAWITTRHDRTERLRALRIEAADDMLQEWAKALFAIDAAIEELQTPSGKLDFLLKTAREHVTAAVKLSVRVDLLFTAISPTASNTTAVRDQARQALHAIEHGDAKAARRLHADASLSQSWLVNAAGEAIDSTGSKRGAARQFKTVLAVSDLDPTVRAGGPGASPPRTKLHRLLGRARGSD